MTTVPHTLAAKLLQVTKNPHADGSLSLAETTRPRCSPGRNEALLADGQRTTEFNWFKFRSQKAARVPSKPGTKDELVFYSRSFSLMRKTTRFWHNTSNRRNNGRI
jgi:hypothetical protein